MSATMYVRGGIPVHVNGTTAVDTVERWPWAGGVANHLWFHNLGAGAIVLSFSEADAAAGRGVTVAAGAIVELPAETAAFWTKAATAGRAFESVAFLRRG